MIDALIMGRLYGKATQRTGGQSGNIFVTCKVRVAASDGEAYFVSVITFSRTVGAGLLAMDDGDSITLSGALTPKIWRDAEGQSRVGLDMTAHALTTIYHVNKKRGAVRGDSMTPWPPS